jgi:iron complex transport system ATP-binding protein
VVRVVQPSAPLEFEPALTVRQIIWTGFFGTLALYQNPTCAMQRRTDALISAIGLEEVGDSAYGLLSTGERVRTLIARAMAIRPRVLVLDEPTTGLDLLAREQVMKTIARIVRTSRNTAILLITHHVEELPPQALQVMVLSRGKVVANGDASAVLRSETLTRAYGVKVEVHHRHGRYYTSVHPHAWKEL